MALTGLQIQKLLPKTNCKECGSNTCMAFAMKLAAKKAELSLCPYASDEAKQVLGEASEPPVKSIALGADKKLVLGEETVLYRHEKTFVNQTALAVNISDTDSPETVAAKISGIKEYLFERVGEEIIIDMAAVTQKKETGDYFMRLISQVREATQKPLVIKSDSTASLIEAAALAGPGSVLCAASPEAAAEVLPAAKEHGLSLAITSPAIDSLVELSAKIKDEGFNNLLLRFDTLSLAEQFQVNTIARRAAIKENFKPFGYPFLRFIDTGSLTEDTVEAVTEINKYGGICVLPDFDEAQLASLMTLRLNIFTDPQNPIQVEPKLYPVGEPTPASPVFVTTNFSLTYFVVSGEIENSGTSAWLIVPECEGMSVLTAWAAGKFNAASIAKFVKEQGLEEKLESRNIIIPGFVSQISGELEEQLPGWKVLIGPQEASDIESFVKNRL
ncbi:MAG: acetyl-CoA decarbonylase/synthase complex subunit gamma [bacterium]|nr:acetyl-CoA decarbonylase/synthase complex subunit gamma [bacterium]